MQDAPINLDGLTPLVLDGDVVPLPPPTQSYSNVAGSAPINERQLQRLIEQGYTKGAKECGVECPSFSGYTIQFIHFLDNFKIDHQDSPCRSTMPRNPSPNESGSLTIRDRCKPWTATKLSPPDDKPIRWKLFPAVDGKKSKPVPVITSKLLLPWKLQRRFE